MKDLLGFAPDGSRRPYILGHFFLDIDIEHFIPLELSRQITGGIIRERGVPVNANLRRELQTMRDELEIAGYESYF